MFDRWKRFADAAGIPTPDEELEAIAPALERMDQAARTLREMDLGLTEPPVCLLLPGGRP